MPPYVDGIKIKGRNSVIKLGVGVSGWRVPCAATCFTMARSKKETLKTERVRARTRVSRLPPSGDTSAYVPYTDQYTDPYKRLQVGHGGLLHHPARLPEPEPGVTLEPGSSFPGLGSRVLGF